MLLSRRCHFTSIIIILHSCSLALVEAFHPPMRSLIPPQRARRAVCRYQSLATNLQASISPETEEDGTSQRLTAASLATTTSLPPEQRGSVHFVNLSNGVEALPTLTGIPFSFVRIQSSHCEANNFNGILGGLDATFLMYLAMGHDCYIYDFGSRNKKRKAPRAVWYGITFIKYALHRSLCFLRLIGPKFISPFLHPRLPLWFER